MDHDFQSYFPRSPWGPQAPPWSAGWVFADASWALGSGHSSLGPHSDTRVLLPVLSSRICGLMSWARAGSEVSSLFGVRSPVRARSPAEKRVGNYAVNNGLRASPWGNATLLCRCLLPRCLHPPRPRSACSQPPAPPLEALLQPSPQPSSSSHCRNPSHPFCSPVLRPHPPAWKVCPALPALSSPSLTEDPSPTRSSRHLGGTSLRVRGDLQVPGEIIPTYSSQRASLAAQW